MVNDYSLGRDPRITQDAPVGLSHLSLLLLYDYMAITINHFSKHHQTTRLLHTHQRIFSIHTVTLLSILYRQAITLSMTRFQRNN